MCTCHALCTCQICTVCALQQPCKDNCLVSSVRTAVTILLQVLERQKAWQQRWRERHEREGTLYDAVAVVEDVIIGRSVPCSSYLHQLGICFT